MLSRIAPDAITEHKLPGLIPGRGVLEVRFGNGPDALHVLILHMALGRRGRLRQIEFLAEQVRSYRHVILMGDLNCRSDSPEMAVLLDKARLRESTPGLYTFPSWQPNRQLDHILVSPSITVERVEVLGYTYSTICRSPWMCVCRRPCVWSPVTVVRPLPSRVPAATVATVQPLSKS